jgi:hypothetical protein
MHDDFGVGAAAEPMALRDQLTTQCLVVVDFTIEYKPDAAVLIAQWLMAAGQIHNRQAPKTERDSGFDMGTLVIRTSVGEHIRHSSERAWRDGFALPRRENAGETTHGYEPPFLGISHSRGAHPSTGIARPLASAVGGKRCGPSYRYPAFPSVMYVL